MFTRGTVVLCAAALAVATSCNRRNASGTTGTGGRAGDGGAGGAAGAAGRGGGAGGAAGTSSGGGVGGASSGSAGGLWTAVPNTAPCVLEVADPARVQIVPFAWVDCGPGCTTTSSKVLPTDDTVLSATATARFDGTDAVVRVATMSGSSYYLQAVRRLQDGALLAGVRAPGPTQRNCGPLGQTQSAPHVLSFFEGTALGSSGISTTATYVAAILKAGGLVWSPPAHDVPFPDTGAFENDLGWGLALSDGTVRAMFPAESGPFTILDEGAIYPAHSAVGRGSLVVSNPAMSGSPDEVIRAWEPSRSSRTIVAQTDTDILAVALSDTTMVWVGVHGPGRWDGTYTAAELYWTPFPAGKDSVPIMGGTAIPAPHALLELQTWGDYAAVIGSDDIGRRLFVIRMSDERLWTIGFRPGTSWVRLLLVTPTQILMGESDASGVPGYQLQRLTRLELDRLDDLAAAW